MLRRALALALASAAALGASAAEPPLASRDYVAQALAASPEVREAQSSFREADASYKAQLSAMLLPTLAFTGQEYPYGDDPSLGYAHHGLRLRRSDMTFNTTVNWNLFNGFQDWLKTRSAAQARDSAARALDAARQDRAYAALQAYYQLSSRARLVDVAKEDLRAQEEQYRQTEDLYKHGYKSLSDLYKSETEWHASQIRLVSAQGDFKAALQPFNELLDAPPWTERTLAVELTPGATDLPDLEGDAARLAARRPEILRARADAERARTAERQSLLGLFPTLAVNADWNRQDTATSGLPSSNFGIVNPNRQLGLTLSLPFGFNVATQGWNYSSARSETRRARAALRSAVRSARDDLYGAWVSLQTASDTYALSVRQEEIAGRALDIVQEQYQQGTADALHIAQARTDLLNARVQTATTLQNIFVSRAGYLRAAGVPLWSSP